MKDVGLYKNKVNHPEIFINEHEIKDNNQSFYKRNFLHDLLEEQKAVNKELLFSFHMLKESFEKQYEVQNRRWMETNQRLEQLNEYNSKREKMEKETIQRLEKLENSQTELHKELITDNKLKDSISNEMETIKILNHQLINQIQLNEADQRELENKISKMMEINIDIKEKVTDLEKKQVTVSEKLDQHEALMEKISRQLTFLRSILFERTHDLAEKIENVYKYMENWFNQWLKRNDENKLLDEKEKELKQKHYHFQK